MTFAHPLLLLSLLVDPARASRSTCSPSGGACAYAVRFTNLDVLASVARRRARGAATSPPLLFLLALAVALRRRSRGRTVTRLRAVRAGDGDPRVDVSGSMQATDVKPTRLAAAQAAVRTFLDKAPKRVRVGARSSSPARRRSRRRRRPTASSCAQSVDELGVFPGFGGTAIGDALAAAVELGQRGGSATARNRDLASAVAALAPSASRRGLVSILFLSDGTQTRGLLQPLEGAAAREGGGHPGLHGRARHPGRHAHPRLRRLRPAHPGAAGPGDAAGDRRPTGGEFFAAASADALEAAYSKLGSTLGRTPGKSEITYAFLAGGIGLLLAAGVLSALWAPRFP